MMAKSSPFSRAAARAKKAEPLTAPDTAPATPLVDRLQRIEEAHQAVRTNTLRVTPDQCRLWARHNRNFERLNETNCRDLIDSFISAGQQELPAIVRPATGQEPVKYEIISGARRYWTVRWLREHHYAHFQYLIEVRDLTDEEAFRLSNVENLDRADISDYERAVDYAQALKSYYQGKQGQMAKRLNKSQSWLSRYLRLARVPVQLADAYAQWHYLKLHHAKDVLAILDNPTYAPALLQRAEELRAQHKKNAERGLSPMSGPEAFKQLKAVVTAPPVSRGPVRSYGPPDRPHLTLKRANRYGLTLHVSKRSDASIDEIVRSIRGCLSDYYEPK